MKYNNSATQLKGKAILSRDSGFLWGSLGVSAFSFTVPMTRLAVENNGLSPLFVGTARAVVAALLAICALSMTKQRMPRKKELLSVSIVALGAVIGFPMLTSYALTTTPASHGAVVIAILPATTAVIAALRTRTYPAGVFWIATGCGAVAAVIFSFSQGATFGALSKNDLFLLAAVVLCAISYAEGGVVSQSLGSWQTISWALIAALPVMLPLAVYSSAHADFNATGSQGCVLPKLALWLTLHINHNRTQYRISESQCQVKILQLRYEKHRHYFAGQRDNFHGHARRTTVPD
ncbi:DMT family transporter [Corynebacterium sp. sy039]|uniref:DMT family transporter n=1 Tax=Corynebacterium sp. sy039 TaxID=2599641 RepID=UPI0011B79991|nr:DMT family transporter [Corynebacterium sp. sy039]QDZ42439.1 DMT family transporter [Corynebacterium sp. sy039]